MNPMSPESLRVKEAAGKKSKERGMMMESKAHLGLAGFADGDRAMSQSRSKGPL